MQTKLPNLPVMNSRLSACFVALAFAMLASCYPYNENAQKKRGTKPPEKTLTAAEQQKVKEQRELAKKEAKANKEEDVKTNPETKSEAGTTPPKNPGTETPKPAAEKRDYSYANKVPGKDGFVFSPYNNKVVDVRDIPSGTLVQDPTYPAADKKYFRVP